MKYLVLFYVLICFTSITTFSQQISLSEQIKAENTVKLYCSYITEYANGDLKKRVLIQDLMETSDNLVYNDIDDNGNIGLGEYLNLIMQKKPSISYSEIPKKEKWLIGKKDDGWQGLVIKMEKKVNGNSKINYFIINIRNNKIRNIYNKLTSSLTYRNLYNNSPKPKINPTPQPKPVVINTTNSDDNFTRNKGTFIDSRDGHVYKWVKIGDQIWMAENLNYKTNNSLWYDNNPKHGKIYGRLYTWYEAMLACPDGWHLSSDEEWKQLEMILGMSQDIANKTLSRGTDEGSKLKSTQRWYNNGNGFNSIGFNALPSGCRIGKGFKSLGRSSLWWLGPRDSLVNAWMRSLDYDSNEIFRQAYPESEGFSIRCVKN